MKKYATTLLASMDPFIFGHIGICYYSSTRKKHSRIIESVYLSAGVNAKRYITRGKKGTFINPARLVVSMPLCREASAAHTLRAMLTAVCLSHDFIRTVPSVRSRLILNSSVKAFISVRKKRYMRMALPILMRLSVKCLAKMQMCTLGGRLSLPSTLKLPDLVKCLITRYLMLINHIQEQNLSISQKILRPYRSKSLMTS